MLPYRIRIHGPPLSGRYGQKYHSAAGETDKGVGQAMTPALDAARCRHEADPLDKLSADDFTLQYLRTQALCL